MKKKERVENKFIKRIKSDYAFRTFISSSLSFFVTVAFAGYNIFLSIAYCTEWNIGIAVYYAILVGIRAFILFSERKLYKLQLTDEQKENTRKTLYFVQSISIFIIDLALIAPITLMVLQKKNVEYSTIPAITIAAYTTYKVIIATVNYIKTRKQQHLSVKILKNINLIDALVSILSLQYVLIMTFGNGIEGEMLVVSSISTFAVWIMILTVSIVTLINAVKIKFKQID